MRANGFGFGAFSGVPSGGGVVSKGAAFNRAHQGNNRKKKKSGMTWEGGHVGVLTPEHFLDNPWLQAAVEEAAVGGGDRGQQQQRQQQQRQQPRQQPSSNHRHNLDADPLAGLEDELAGLSPMKSEQQAQRYAGPTSSPPRAPGPDELDLQHLSPMKAERHPVGVRPRSRDPAGFNPLASPGLHGLPSRRSEEAPWAGPPRPPFQDGVDLRPYHKKTATPVHVEDIESQASSNSQRSALAGMQVRSGGVYQRAPQGENGSMPRPNLLERRPSYTERRPPPLAIDNPSSRSPHQPLPQPQGPHGHHGGHHGQAPPAQGLFSPPARVMPRGIPPPEQHMEPPYHYQQPQPQPRPMAMRYGGDHVQAPGYSGRGIRGGHYYHAGTAPEADVGGPQILQQQRRFLDRHGGPQLSVQTGAEAPPRGPPGYQRYHEAPEYKGGKGYYQPSAPGPGMPPHERLPGIQAGPGRSDPYRAVY